MSHVQVWQLVDIVNCILFVVKLEINCVVARGRSCGTVYACLGFDVCVLHLERFISIPAFSHNVPPELQCSQPFIK